MSITCTFVPAAADSARFPDTARGAGSCRPCGCAGLCTEDGLAAAYAAHHARMLARALRVVVDRHLAEEAVQEAFTRAWRSCSTFDPEGGPVVSWLLAITGNVAVDLVRARARRPRLAPSGAASEVFAHAGGLELVLAREELRDALAQLSEEQRHAVLETIVLDRPYEETARDLGVHAGTVRTRVHYGLRRLRALMAA